MEMSESPADSQQQQQVFVDDSEANTCYANFCRVSSTPEELILDLGLNPNAPTNAPQTVKVSQRVVVNHFTAKRMLMALSMAVQQYERTFGNLEVDVRKRVKPQAGQG